MNQTTKKGIYWVLLVGVAFLLRWPHINETGFSSEETKFRYSLHLSQPPALKYSPLFEESPVILAFHTTFNKIWPENPVPLRWAMVGADIGCLPIIQAIGVSTFGWPAAVLTTWLYALHPLSIWLSHSIQGAPLIALLSLLLIRLFINFLSKFPSPLAGEADQPFINKSTSPPVGEGGGGGFLYVNHHMWVWVVKEWIWPYFFPGLLCSLALGPWFSLIILSSLTAVALVCYWASELSENKDRENQSLSHRSLWAFGVLLPVVLFTAFHFTGESKTNRKGENEISVIQQTVPPPNSIIGHAYLTLSKVYAVCVDQVPPNNLPALRQSAGYKYFLGYYFILMGVWVIGLYGTKTDFLPGLVSLAVTTVVAPIVTFDLSRYFKLPYDFGFSLFLLPIFLLVLSKGFMDIASRVAKTMSQVIRAPVFLSLPTHLLIASSLAILLTAKPFATALKHYYQQPFIHRTVWTQPLQEILGRLQPGHVVIFYNEELYMNCSNAVSRALPLAAPLPSVFPPNGYLSITLQNKPITVVPSLNQAWSYLADQRARPHAWIVSLNTPEAVRTITTKFIGVIDSEISHTSKNILLWKSRLH